MPEKGTGAVWPTERPTGVLLGPEQQRRKGSCAFGGDLFGVAGQFFVEQAAQLQENKGQGSTLAV